MWALEHDERYEIDNIPFYVTSLAMGDLVAVRRDENGLLWFTEVTQSGGHTTIQILFADAQDVASFRAQLDQMGCSSEQSDISELIAVDIPPAVKYEKIKSMLDEGEREGRFEYQEACLGSLLPTVSRASKRHHSGTVVQRTMSSRASQREIAAFICLHVLDATHPVLLVAKEHGDWVFLCDGMHGGDNECHLAGRNHLLDRDVTLGEVMNLVNGPPSPQAQGNRQGAKTPSS
jgi:hypothetical protein